MCAAFATGISFARQLANRPSTGELNGNDVEPTDSETSALVMTRPRCRNILGRT
jgi:hypothetical protein